MSAGSKVCGQQVPWLNHYLYSIHFFHMKPFFIALKLLTKILHLEPKKTQVTQM